MARHDVVLPLGAESPAAKSAMWQLLTDTLNHAAGLPRRQDSETRLVVDVGPDTALSPQARLMLLREFPSTRPQLRVVLRSKGEAPAGLLRAARAAGVAVVFR